MTRQNSCLHTPEQNGVVERKHRHIVETGLTLLCNANVPLFPWVEAFMTVVFLINRIPTSTLNMKSLFLKLHGKKPDYNALIYLYVDAFHILEGRI